MINICVKNPTQTKNARSNPQLVLGLGRDRLASTSKTSINFSTPIILAIGSSFRAVTATATIQERMQSRFHRSK